MWILLNCKYARGLDFSLFWTSCLANGIMDHLSKGEAIQMVSFLGDFGPP